MGAGGRRCSESSARKWRRKSPTVDPLGTSISTRSRPNTSAYEAKKSAVMVMSYTRQWSDGSQDRPNAKRAAATEGPGALSSTNSLSRFCFACLGLGLELFDAGDHRSQLLRGLEDRDGSSRHLDRRSRARVASHSGLAVANLEGA